MIVCHILFTTLFNNSTAFVILERSGLKIGEFCSRWSREALPPLSHYVTAPPPTGAKFKFMPRGWLKAKRANGSHTPSAILILTPHRSAEPLFAKNRGTLLTSLILNYIANANFSAPLSKKRSCHEVTEEFEKPYTAFTSLTINNISTKSNLVLLFR